MLIISRNLADPRLHADLARFWEARRLKQMQNVASDAKRSCPGDVHTYRMLYEALLGSLSGSTGARPIRSPLRFGVSLWLAQRSSEPSELRTL